MTDKKTCVLLGAGGHAKVLIDCVSHFRDIKIAAITDPDEKLWGTKIVDIPVIGNDEKISNSIAMGVKYFIVGVGSTGNNIFRKKLFELGISNKLLPLTVIHPTAIVSKYSTIGEGSQILAGAIVNTGADIGENVIINSGAIVEHDCVINNHVHIATGATLSGTVKVGELSHIGTGASIRQSITIGCETVIGAGAVVVKDAISRKTYIGNPAKPI